MLEQEIYEKLVDWLGKTWWGLPDSDQLMPIIRARYTLEEAEFLTGMRFMDRRWKNWRKPKAGIRKSWGPGWTNWREKE